jgi:hypothetical protein
MGEIPSAPELATMMIAKSAFMVGKMAGRAAFWPLIRIEFGGA